LDSSYQQFDTYPDPHLGSRSLSFENTYTQPPTYTTSTLPPYISPTHNNSEQNLIPRRKPTQAGRRQVVYCTKEQLLARSAERKRRFEEQQIRERAERAERLGREGNMAATGNAIANEERRRSFGIGGAGNIRMSPFQTCSTSFVFFCSFGGFGRKVIMDTNCVRYIGRPSDVIYPIRRESIAENDMGDTAAKKKRRSSVWSMGTSGDATGSSPGKKGVWGFWRRASDA
jgi:hypothetical protein